MINDINNILADNFYSYYQLALSHGDTELASHYLCQYLFHIGAA